MPEQYAKGKKRERDEKFEKRLIPVARKKGLLSKLFS